MSNVSDFIIENGVLKKYNGPGGDVTIPEGVTSIGNWAFYCCKSLTSVTIPDSVTSVGDSAFYGCSGLASVTIPEGVASIGDYVFCGCSGLTSVTIPESVTSIGNSAFRDCSSLASVTIPGSVTSIGDKAFYDCGNVQFSCSDTISKYLLTCFYQIENGGLKKYKGPGGDVTIPEGVTSIGDSAFIECSSLASVTIPGSVTSIGSWAFYGCESLASVTIPGSVTSIGNEAFFLCQSLASVTIPEGVTSIGNKAFYGCKSLKSVTIPDSVTSIGSWAFYGCSCLRTASIPDTIGEGEQMEAGLLCLLGEKSMSELISQVKTWYKDGREVFFTSYLVSDTRAAMLLAEKRQELDKYAALRGMDVDELRDQYLSDLGLDALGRKSYDLGNAVVSVRMSPDLGFAVELPDGKTAKSLPKKGTDPAKFDAANRDFAQIKKDAKKIWKNRADLLLGDFISGRERTAAYWQKTYGGNPILHRVACLLVWQQGKSCFLCTDEGLVTADGGVYELTEEKIRLAHPIELDAEELAAWQRYFTAHGLKQPFAQIWERAYTPEEIAPDRYAGCPILFFQLQGASKHGFDHQLEIPGCKIKAKWSSETAPNGSQVSYCDIKRFQI